MKHTIFKAGRKAGKRALAFTLALGLLLTGCGGATTAAKDAPGSQWIDSDIIGSIQPDQTFREQDDFAAAVNKDALLDEESDSLMDSLIHSIYDRKRAILSDESIQSEGLTEARKYVELVENWDIRNKTGVEPLRKYLEYIEEVSDLDSFYNYICDTEKNPLGHGPLIVDNVIRSEASPSNYTTVLTAGSLSLGDANNYFSMDANVIGAKMSVNEKVSYVLERLGYSTNDINRILDESYKIEKIFAGNISTITNDDYRDTTYSRVDLEAAAGNYPVLSFLDAWGFEKTETYNIDIGFVRQLDQMCNSDNVENLKSYMTVRYVLSCCAFLDKEAYEKHRELSKSRAVAGTAKEQEEQKAKEEKKTDLDRQRDQDALLFDNYFRTSQVLTAYLNKAYVEEYVDKNCKDRLYKMTEKIIETYHDVFNSEEWLSEEGKAACIEKLDAITIHIAYPDNDDLNLFGMNITSAEDGGNLLDAVMEIAKSNNRRDGYLSSTPFDRTYWDPYNVDFSTSDMNAYYSPQNNGIYILAGIINDPMYFEGISDEELYGGIGCVVGHEITHGFDEGGVRYNKDGLEVQWMPAEDQAAFTDKSGKVAKFYSTLPTYPGASLYDGFQVNREATADMGGMRVTLKIAEENPNFDYDKYFRKYASFFAAKATLEEEMDRFSADVHPLGFLRINVACAQFDEFYETYDVKPGDGMYIDERHRVKVW